ncbi:2,3-diaminopropionate biosynthesis protein SbnA [Endothiovibrio diazotrophicus]
MSDCREGRRGILASIGNTPLVELSSLYTGKPVKYYAKLESVNPGGSIKDRTALSMIDNAIADGRITQHTTVVESSSGNLGVGLAQICAYYKLKFVCIVDPHANAHNVNIIKAYGGRIEYVSEPDIETGEFLPARIARAKLLCQKDRDYFWVNQYSNIHNPLAHRETMREIADQLDGKIDYLFCAVSTCGTVRGCAEYVRESGLDTRIVAVDVAGSRIFPGGVAKRHFPGMGAGVRSPHCDDGLIAGYVLVSEQDCIRSCHRIVAREGLLLGASSGGVAAAVEAMQEHIEEGSNCVMIFADRGERYLDTLYSEEWIMQCFGEKCGEAFPGGGPYQASAPVVTLFDWNGGVSTEHSMDH